MSLDTFVVGGDCKLSIFSHLKHWLEHRELKAVLHHLDTDTENGKECFVHIYFDETKHYLYTHDYWLEQCKGNLYFINF